VDRSSRANVSIKLSALDFNVDAIDHENVVARLVRGAAADPRCARRSGTAITFDMEQHALKDIPWPYSARCCEQVDVDAGVAYRPI